MYFPSYLIHLSLCRPCVLYNNLNLNPFLIINRCPSVRRYQFSWLLPHKMNLDVSTKRLLLPTVLKFLLSKPCYYLCEFFSKPTFRRQLLYNPYFYGSLQHFYLQLSKFLLFLKFLNYPIYLCRCLFVFFPYIPSLFIYHISFTFTIINHLSMRSTISSLL